MTELTGICDWDSYNSKHINRVIGGRDVINTEGRVFKRVPIQYAIHYQSISAVFHSKDYKNACSHIAFQRLYTVDTHRHLCPGYIKYF